MSRVLLDRPYVCPLCHHKVRQLYPLTHYDPKARHFVNVKACLSCCGPAGDEGPTFDIFRHRVIER